MCVRPDLLLHFPEANGGTLPPEEVPLDTEDDENVLPIGNVGSSILRNMGFGEDSEQADENEAPSNTAPVPRPLGVGLGADRSSLSMTLHAPPVSDEVMMIGALVKVQDFITDGGYLYGTIESMDQDTNRAVVNFALDGTMQWVNAYWLEVVSKEEYDQYAKLCNFAKKKQSRKQKRRAVGRIQTGSLRRWKRSFLNSISKYIFTLNRL